jgi:hypothetical protein
MRRRRDVPHPACYYLYLEASTANLRDDVYELVSEDERAKVALITPALVVLSTEEGTLRRSRRGSKCSTARHSDTEKKDPALRKDGENQVDF